MSIESVESRKEIKHTIKSNENVTRDSKMEKWENKVGMISKDSSVHNSQQASFP